GREAGARETDGGGVAGGGGRARGRGALHAGRAEARGSGGGTRGAGGRAGDPPARLPCPGAWPVLEPLAPGDRPGRREARRASGRGLRPRAGRGGRGRSPGRKTSFHALDASLRVAIIPRLPDRVAERSPCTSTLERPSDAIGYVASSELPWASGVSQRLFYVAKQRRSLKTQQRAFTSRPRRRPRMPTRLRTTCHVPSGTDFEHKLKVKRSPALAAGNHSSRRV